MWTHSVELFIIIEIAQKIQSDFAHLCFHSRWNFIFEFWFYCKTFYWIGFAIKTLVKKNNLYRNNDSTNPIPAQIQIETDLIPIYFSNVTHTNDWFSIHFEWDFKILIKMNVRKFFMPFLDGIKCDFYVLT